MTAAALDRVGAALTTRSATVFFDALTAADEHIRRDEQLAEDAAVAPPVTAFAKCVCESTFTAREDRIELTDREKLAAAEQLADMLGRSLHDDVDPQLVVGVVDAINAERARQAYEDQDNWNLCHDYCGDLS